MPVMQTSSLNDFSWIVGHPQNGGLRMVKPPPMAGLATQVTFFFFFFFFLFCIDMICIARGQEDYSAIPKRPPKSFLFFKNLFVLLR
jgi:hypothetical protein